MIDESEVIIRVRDENTVAIMPPTETEPENISAIKIFLMMCLHRRILDVDFQEEMVEWMNGYTPEELQEEIQSAIRKVQH